MSEDPSKVFGARDLYDHRVVLRVSKGHTGRDGAPLMIFGVHGPGYGRTVRIGPKEVEALAPFIAEYLGKNLLPILQPHWFLEAEKGLTRVDGRVRVRPHQLIPGAPVKWAAEKKVTDDQDWPAVYVLLRDSKDRIRYFPTAVEAAEFADQYAPLGLVDRGVQAVEIKPACHILWEGLPLCRFTHKVPGEWPEGHTWVSKMQWKAAPEESLCELCKDELEE